MRRNYRICSPSQALPTTDSTSMPRRPAASTSQGRRPLLVLVTAVLLAGCSVRTPRIRDQSYNPGTHVIEYDGLKVELTATRYERRNITLQLHFENRGTVPLVIKRDGILLEAGGLEFPVGDLKNHPVPPTIELKPAASQQLAIAFVLGGELAKSGTLYFRAVQQGPAWGETFHLRIPAAPPVADPK